MGTITLIIDAISNQKTRFLTGDAKIIEKIKKLKNLLFDTKKY